jgi:hypothetical protein
MESREGAKKEREDFTRRRVIVRASKGAGQKKLITQILFHCKYDGFAVNRE